MTLLALGLFLAVFFQDILPIQLLGRWRVPLEVVLALAYLTVLIYLTGGRASPYFFGYALLLFAGALLADWLWPAVLMLATAAAYLAGVFIAPDSLPLDQAAVGVVSFNVIAFSLVAYVASAIGREQRRAREAAIWLSRSDALTGLPNRAHFQAQIEQEILRASRTGRPFGLLMIDLDGLKAANDRFGHASGAQLIQAVADVLRGDTRAIDLAARFGADPDAAYAGIVAQISEVWMSLTGIFNSHLIMAAAVARFGTEAQKREFLPKFASGEVRGGLALTEPDCGTDLQAIRTRAVRDGGHYVINGTKTWISNGIKGSCFALLVKTDPAAEPRHRGMSLFLAEKGEGFRVSKKLDKLGYKGIDSAELIFEDYRVPADRLIGGAEGRGLQQALGGLELGRINVAARGVGVAQAALDEAVAYSQIRRTFGKPICEHQAIQLKLGEMATRCEAARLLLASAARAYAAGQRCAM